MCYFKCSIIVTIACTFRNGSKCMRACAWWIVQKALSYGWATRPQWAGNLTATAMAKYCDPTPTECAIQLALGARYVPQLEMCGILSGHVTPILHKDSWGSSEVITVTHTAWCVSVITDWAFWFHYFPCPLYQRNRSDVASCRALNQLASLLAQPSIKAAALYALR